MTDSQDTTAQEIPQGFCQCGCGRKTNLAKKTYASEGIRKGEPRSYLPGHQFKGVYRTPPVGKLNGRWKGGRVLNGGYIAIWKPDHPRADRYGYVPEHILVMENALGRHIPKGEIVHHIDEDRLNNSIGNLMLFKTVAMHNAFHSCLRAFKQTGHWDWINCPFCHQYDDPKNMFVSKVTKMHYHRECMNLDRRQRKINGLKS